MLLTQQRADGVAGYAGGAGDYFRGVRTLHIAPLLVLFIALMVGCSKDGTSSEDDGAAASIVFRVDTDYFYQDMHADTLDTLAVRMTASRGSDALVKFRLTVSYDDSAARVTDTAVINVDPFVFERTITTRTQHGTEKWTFNVYEGDGDLTRRSITLTVP